MPKPTTALLATSATLVIAGYSIQTLLKSKSNSDDVTTIPLSKSVSESSITYVVRILPEHVDSNGRAYGGEILKLLDVASGLVAAIHSSAKCLTISLDRVTFMTSINVGDCLKLSVAVNRSFGSSMEIGVKVIKEATDKNKEEYCCHAYFTFVKIRPEPIPPSTLVSIAQSLHILSPTPILPNKVPELIPTSTLEQKRWLLAGRRRNRRMNGRKAGDKLLEAFSQQLLDLELESKLSKESLETTEERTILLEALQKEMIVEAYMRNDPDVKIEGDELVVVIEGFKDEIRMSLKEVEKATNIRGKGGYRRLTIPTSDNQDHIVERENYNRKVEVQAPIDLQDTSAMCCWIVRPQHCNSKNILFGGQLIRFEEEVASIAARRISSSNPWLTASIDSLTFKSPVHPGEVVKVRAWVINTYDSSVEIFTLVEAQDRNSANPKTRLVSESFFTLVAIDTASGRPLKGRLRDVKVPDGPAKEVSEGGGKRREDRLQDKRILQRVYA